MSNLGDPSVQNADVRAVSRRACPIDNHPAADEEIKFRHNSGFLLEKGCK
jgi:hypothetical protein